MKAPSLLGWDLHNLTQQELHPHLCRLEGQVSTAPIWGMLDL